MKLCGKDSQKSKDASKCKDEEISEFKRGFSTLRKDIVDARLGT